MSVQAIQVEAISKTVEDGIKNLKYNTIARSELHSSDVRIKVYASALNFFDNLLLIGQYQNKPSLPFTAGNELSGVVVEVGKDVKDFKIGQEVICAFTGTLATEIVVPSIMCWPKPPQFSHVEASGFWTGFYTGYHALVHRGKLKAGETLLVTGAGGGMGLAAIQIGKLLGAKVIAAASSDDKLESCRKAGADFCVNYSKQDLKSEVSKFSSSGCDVIYESVGGSVFDQSMRCTATSGCRLLVIGFASGTIPKIPANHVLVKGVSVIGVRAGAELALNQDLAQEMRETLAKWTRDGSIVKLKPAVDPRFVVSWENAREAFRFIASKQVVGKAVIVVHDQTKSKL